MQPKAPAKQLHKVAGLDLMRLQLLVKNENIAEIAGTEYRGQSTMQTEEKSRGASNLKHSVCKVASDKSLPYS